MFSPKWQRRRNILKTLSISSLFLAGTAFIISVLDKLSKGAAYRGLSPEIILAINIFFFLVFWANKKHYTKIAAGVFISFYFIINSYFVYRWGVGLPITIMIYSLMIILTGILLGNLKALILTALSSSFIILMTYLESSKLISPAVYWRQNNIQIADKIPEIFILAIIFIVVYLYNQEINKSFRELNKTQKELEKEKNSLASKVAEKEKEINELHLQKMSDIYKLAELGRNSSSIFHDLMNPLTAVSLNIQKINDQKSQHYLEEALVATKKMESFISALKKHIKNETVWENFCLNEELEQLLKILQHRLIKNNIKIKIINEQKIHSYGPRYKFNQVLLNLISNAIDAYDEVERQEKKIKINLSLKDGKIVLSVEDFGKGIKKENLEKIWEIFFTTKNSSYAGTGIGLACTKKIITEDFAGEIKVKSQENQGTKFICTFPQKYEKKNGNKLFCPKSLPSPKKTLQ